jgi:hypothetical protein
MSLAPMRRGLFAESTKAERLEAILSFDYFLNGSGGLRTDGRALLMIRSWI